MITTDKVSEQTWHCLNNIAPEQEQLPLVIHEGGVYVFLCFCPKLALNSYQNECKAKYVYFWTPQMETPLPAVQTTEI